MDVPLPLVKAAGCAGRSRQPEQAHREVCSWSVAAVGGLRGALHPGVFRLVLLADRAGARLGRQRRRSRGEDEGCKQGLGEHGGLRGGAWAGEVRYQAACRGNIPQSDESGRELLHAGKFFLLGWRPSTTAAVFLSIAKSATVSWTACRD